MRLHAPADSLVGTRSACVYIYTYIQPRKWHPNRFTSRGWLRNPSPRGVGSCVSCHYVYTYTHNIQNPYLFPRRCYRFGFFLSHSLNDQNVLFRTRHRCSCPVWRFSDVFFFFIIISNTKPTPVQKRSPIVSTRWRQTDRWILCMGVFITHAHSPNVKYIQNDP